MDIFYIFTLTDIQLYGIINAVEYYSIGQLYPFEPIAKKVNFMRDFYMLGQCISAQNAFSASFKEVIQ